MNPEYTISSKIVMMEESPDFGFFKNNMVLLNNVNERYLIKDQPTPTNPSQSPPTAESLFYSSNNQIIENGLLPILNHKISQLKFLCLGNCFFI